MEIDYSTVMSSEEIDSKFPTLDQALYRINKEAKIYRDIRNELINYIYNNEPLSKDTSKLLKRCTLKEALDAKVKKDYWTKKDKLPNDVKRYEDLKRVLHRYTYVYIISKLIRTPNLPKYPDSLDELLSITGDKVLFKDMDFRIKKNKLMFTDNWTTFDDDIIKVILMIFNDYNLDEDKLKSICDYNIIQLYRHIYNCFSGVSSTILLWISIGSVTAHELTYRYKRKIDKIYKLKEKCIKYLGLEVLGWNLAYTDYYGAQYYCPLYQYGMFTFHGKPRTINKKNKNIISEDNLYVSAEINSDKCTLTYDEALSIINDFVVPFTLQRKKILEDHARKRKERNKLKQIEHAKMQKRLRAERYFNLRLNKKDLKLRGWTVPLMQQVFGYANKKTRFNLEQVLSYEREHPKKFNK